MVRWRLIACVVVIVLAACRGEGQTGSPALQKELDGIRATQKLLDEVIATEGLQAAMPFAKFLDELARRVAKVGQLTVRIDQDALGKSFAAVTQSPVHLPPVPRQMSVGTALRLAVGQLKVESSYRVEPTCVTITTPGRPSGPLHAADYDVRDIVEKSPERDRDSAALRIVQAIINRWDYLPDSHGGGAVPTIQIRDAHVLVIRTSALGHLEVIDVLTALHRMADLAVIIQAQLYEVDDAFHSRLRKAKRVSLDEAEQRFLEGKAPKDDLFNLLAKEKPVHVGAKAKVNDGAAVALLSRYNVVTCLPAPAQARKGKTARQAIPEGVGFTGTVEVSPDRRSVRLRFTEKASHIEDRLRVKVSPLGFQHNYEGNHLGPPKDIDAEQVFVNESTTTRTLEIPDGGLILVAVQYRPAALAAKQRWWVLSITPRIWIEEEERLIREGKIAPNP
jgi:hypothetical protein